MQRLTVMTVRPPRQYVLPLGHIHYAQMNALYLHKISLWLERELTDGATVSIVEQTGRLKAIAQGAHLASDLAVGTLAAVQI
jgi:hypothetical protein